MALELKTGYWGTNHVTAEQEADANAGIVGADAIVLPIGERMRAEAVTSNKIRIFDGIYMGYGRQCIINEGGYEDVEVENGTVGLLRNDMIVIEYKKDEVTGVEGVSFKVLKGQTGTTATDPTPNNQNIRSGSFESELPMYRVKLNGLAIEAIEPLYEITMTNKDLSNAYDKLNRKISDVVVLLKTTEVKEGTSYALDESYRNFDRVFVRLSLSTAPSNDLSDAIEIPTALLNNSTNHISKRLSATEAIYAHVQCGFESETSFKATYLRITGSFNVYASVYGIQRNNS